MAAKLLDFQTDTDRFTKHLSKKVAHRFADYTVNAIVQKGEPPNVVPILAAYVAVDILFT